MDKYLKGMEKQVYSSEESKIFKVSGVAQEFSVGCQFWDDSYNPPWLRLWVEGMEREKGSPRAFTPDDMRALFLLR